MSPDAPGTPDSNSGEIALLPYYVYELRDPRDNAVFYVGKGTRDRLDAHHAEEENSKAARIASIEQAGLAVQRIIIGRFATEDEALAVESVLIKWTYGFDHLTNLVHGHRHRFIRPHQHQAKARYPVLPGIDRPRLIQAARDGSYTEALRQQISAHQILEKLESLRDALRARADLQGLDIGDPDLSVPQDPCLLITGLPSAAVALQLKMQLTGATVVLNLVPAGRTQLSAFRAALTGLAQPYALSKGNGRFGGLYCQTHDFRSADGGFPRGVPQEQVAVIAGLIAQTRQRLGVRP